MSTCPDCGLRVGPSLDRCFNCLGILEWNDEKTVNIIGYDFGLLTQKKEIDFILDRPVFSCLSLDMKKWRLQIVFRAKKCLFACHFCDIRNNGLDKMPSEENITNQLAYAIHQHSFHLSKVKLVAIGAEGTIWNRENFPVKALPRICEFLNKTMPNATIQIEGRADLLPKLDTNFYLKLLEGKFGVKTSLETINDNIRNGVLGKRLSKKTFLNNISDLLSQQVDLTVFVIVKPSHEMNDEAALNEAKKTCKFIMDIGDRHRSMIKIRASSMYAAKGTNWTRKIADYPRFEPPTITTMSKLAKYVRNRGHLISLRLWEENSCGLNQTFWNRPDATIVAFNKVLRFNQSQNVRLIEEIIEGKTGMDEREGQEKLILIKQNK